MAGEGGKWIRKRSSPLCSVVRFKRSIGGHPYPPWFRSDSLPTLVSDTWIRGESRACLFCQWNNDNVIAPARFATAPLPATWATIGRGYANMASVSKTLASRPADSRPDESRLRHESAHATSITGYIYIYILHIRPLEQIERDAISPLRSSISRWRIIFQDIFLNSIEMFYSKKENIRLE